MPDEQVYNFNTPLGKAVIRCRKDAEFFYCGVNVSVYRKEFKVERQDLAEKVQKFLEWLK